ncbi:MAG: hypothetical protein M3357_07620 [Actinomycetota bacterium]|nr:hypothetical protein [Actinomycetota bacterium]
MRKHGVTIVAALLVSGLLVMPTAATTSSAEAVDAEEVFTVARVTAKYLDEAKAPQDGFRRTNVCVSRPPQAGGGAMGYHYTNQARFDRELNIAEPETVIYGPRRSSTGATRKLVAVEYFLVDEDQDLSTNEHPVLLGQPMDGPMPGHPEPDHPTNPNWMPIHYELHVWMWLANPWGPFNGWNPNVVCPAA